MSNKTDANRLLEQEGPCASRNAKDPCAGHGHDQGDDGQGDDGQGDGREFGCARDFEHEFGREFGHGRAYGRGHGCSRDASTSVAERGAKEVLPGIRA